MGVRVTRKRRVACVDAALMMLTGSSSFSLRVLESNGCSCFESSNSLYGIHPGNGTAPQYVVNKPFNGLNIISSLNNIRLNLCFHSRICVCRLKQN